MDGTLAPETARDPRVHQAREHHAALVTAPPIAPDVAPVATTVVGRANGNSNADGNVTSRRVAIVGSIAGVGAAGLFLASLAVANQVLHRFRGDVPLAASMVVLTAVLVALLGAGGMARELFHWRRPTRQLAKLVNEARAGEAPLADLDRIGGGAHVLVEPLRTILLDLREARRTNAELQEEMRRRILNRTDALERQLGALKMQAARDPMTGLGNRREFDATSAQVFKACAESCEDLCALMIDVDNFKPLNDTLGHAAGDELLKSIGEIVRSSIREHDTAYRVGGDEFVILLPRASRAIGERLAARLASLVDHLVRPLKLKYPPGLSIGSAALSDQKMTEPRQLLELADRRLYEAKGRKPERARRSVA